MRQRRRVQEICESRFLNLLYSIGSLPISSRNSKFKCCCYLRVLIVQVAVNGGKERRAFFFFFDVQRISTCDV